MKTNLTVSPLWFEFFCLDTIKNMETDCTHLKRQMELLTLDLERLNKLIYKESTTKTTLERNNLLSEGDFVRELKVCTNRIF